MEIWQGIYYHLAGVIFYSRFIFSPSSAEKDSFLAHRHISAMSCPAGTWQPVVLGKESHSQTRLEVLPWIFLFPGHVVWAAALLIFIRSCLQPVIGVQGGQTGLAELCAG